MPDRHHEDEVFVEKWPFDQVGAGVGQVDDRRVDGAAHELRFEGARGAVPDHQPDGGMVDGEAFEKQRCQPPRRGADHAQVDGSGELAAHRDHVGHHGVDLRRNPSGPLDYSRALLGEGPGLTVDELHPQLTLQASHVGGDVGLHGVEGNGGG